MNNPAISIILPTYNGSKYIRTSIDSCLAQTFQDFELIIVNDCSTDDTLSIAQEYAQKDARVRIVNNPFNRKLPLSLNAGFDEAKGAYFTWTSDDNYYASDALQRMYDALQKNPAIDLVYTDYYIIDDKGDVTGKRIFNDVNNSFHHWLGAGACFLYKAEVHKVNSGYNPAAFLIEDYDFFVRAYMKFNFLYLATPELYYYREHDASLTAANASVVNDISKIFIERNLSGLVKKLPIHESALLYRKLAIHYAVSKNNSIKYKEYLQKVYTISAKQTLVTVGYVMVRKFYFAFLLSFQGIGYFIKLLFSKRL